MHSEQYGTHQPGPGWGSHLKNSKKKRKHDSKALKALRTMLFWVGAVLVVLGVVASLFLISASDADLIQALYFPLLDLEAVNDVRENEMSGELMKYTAGAALVGAVFIMLSGKVLPNTSK